MTEARMGQYIREYKPRRNLHRLINNLFTTSRPAFLPSAIVTQTKQLPDVSFYQAVINWDQMRARTDAVIIRAGQNVWPDEQFTRNWQTARHVGMNRGCYWFYDDRADPGRQADLLVALLQSDPPEMEIWCDWENSYGGGFGGLRNVVAFMQRVESKMPLARVGMYTGYWWFREHSNAFTNAAHYNYLKTRPLWLAWYALNAELVKIPAPWTSLLLWQWGTPAIGSLYGVETIEIDMNYFNGTQAEFETRYGADTIPPPETGGSMWYRATGNINIRQMGVTGAPAVTSGERYVLTNDIVEVELVQGGFAKLLRLYRYDFRQELAPVAWCGMAYLRSTTYTPPNVEPPPDPEPEPQEPDYITAHFTDGSTKKYVPE